MEDKPAELQIYSPPFERTDGIVVQTPTPELFDVLHTKSEAELRALGMCPWDGVLWLFPHEWYAHIPDHLIVGSISDDEEDFSRWDSRPRGDDMRFGVLAYGIIPNFAIYNEKEPEQ